MSLKTITATVGEGGTNIPADVATVQYLLNCVPASNGGPVKELKIDGFAGVVTIEAINRFQKVHFGASDSRVQSGEATFNELKKYDPLPFSAPVIAPNFKLSTTASMDPSKMNRSVAHEGIKRALEGVKKSIDGGGIKRQLYGGVKDDSV
jgi:peptidoglycan hydrolase-like protein with peptidoglycan-binding domain